MITLKDLKQRIMQIRRRPTFYKIDEDYDDSLLTGEKVTCTKWSYDELLRENERLNKNRLKLIVANERLTKDNLQLTHSLEHLRNTMMSKQQK